MSFVISNERTFKLVPEYDGPLLCVDYTEPVEEETQWGKKLKFQFVFELQPENPTPDQLTDDGKRLTIRSRKFVPSLNEKAALYKFLKDWFGKDFASKVDMKNFDLGSVVGESMKAIIEHQEYEEKTYANIVLARPWTGNTDHFKSDYTRIQDRENKASEAPKTEVPSNEDKLPSWANAKVIAGKHKGKALSALEEADLKILWEKWATKLDPETAKMEEESFKEDLRQAVATVDPDFDFEDDIPF